MHEDGYERDGLNLRRPKPDHVQVVSSSRNYDERRDWDRADEENHGSIPERIKKQRQEIT